jgi:hypothetical protein
MNTRSIRSLASVRSGLLSAIQADLPEEAMNALVDQLSEIEARIVAAPCNTYVELAIKSNLLAEKLADESSYDPLIASIIEQLPRDLANVESTTQRDNVRQLGRAA